MDDYFRGDQKSGITPPDLLKDVDYADHIVKARGKRTQFTSVYKERGRIRDFGDQIYQLKRSRIDGDRHQLVEHQTLVGALQEQARGADRAVRLKAVQALRYAKMRLEGLVDWRCDISGVDKKERFTWAASHIRPYFTKKKGK